MREEIELAKAEVSEKVNKLIRGTVVGTAAGIFAVFGLVILLEGVAWLLFALFFDDVYWGFFLVAGGLYGLTAAIVTLILAFPVSYYLAPSTARFFGESSSFDYLIHNLGQVTLLVVGSGLLVGVGSSLIAVNRYLRGKA